MLGHSGIRRMGKGRSILTRDRAKTTIESMSSSSLLGPLNIGQQKKELLFHPPVGHLFGTFHHHSHHVQSQGELVLMKSEDFSKPPFHSISTDCIGDDSILHHTAKSGPPKSIGQHLPYHPIARDLFTV
jgi:hypothetical protein